MGVRDKVCIMTGGGSGIGRSAALMMAQQGAKLALAGRTASKVEAVRDEIVAAGGEAIAFGLDVSDIDGVRDMVKQTLKGVWAHRYFGQQCRAQLAAPPHPNHTAGGNSRGDRLQSCRHDVLYAGRVAKHDRGR